MVDITSLAPQVIEHALRESPRECCGLAVLTKGRLRYSPCTNLSIGTDQFEIDPEEYAACEEAGEVVGICHSHVLLPPRPSEADLVMCERTGLPWLIVSVPNGTHTLIEPKGYEAPLTGRPYTHGVLDCYQICKDYYARTLGVNLPDFNRPDDWWLKGKSLYLDNLGEAGFVIMGDGNYADARPHDAFLLQAGSPVPNHAAVYLGDNIILHHVAGRLSSKDVYGGYWRKNTTHVLRHRSLL
jgi:proteasome lid subunit RPN8/RPN11